MKKSIRDIDVRGKRALVRVDFNVPTDPDTGAISDDSRIRLSLPTLRYLLDHGASVVACSHFGRPNGKVVDKFRLNAVRARLGQLLGQDVVDAGGPAGEGPARTVRALKPGQLAMLENLRFDPREESNDDSFARELAGLGDVFVNDAFGAAHRAHASTAGVARHLPAVAGLLMAREIEMLGQALSSTARPVVAVIGGAKVADKIQVLTNLAPRVDAVLIGGGMAAAFLKASGLRSGKTEITADEVAAARDLLSKRTPKVFVPEDVVVAREFSGSATASVVSKDKVPDDALVLDIGPIASRTFAAEIARAKLVLWNGPMGVFEWEQFAAGTRAVAEAIAGNRSATSVIGGGSTAEVVEKLGMRERFTHVSTGGGASLEFLEGKTLPGVAALLDK